MQFNQDLPTYNVSIYLRTESLECEKRHSPNMIKSASSKLIHNLRMWSQSASPLTQGTSMRQSNAIHILSPNVKVIAYSLCCYKRKRIYDFYSKIHNPWSPRSETFGNICHLPKFSVIDNRPLSITGKVWRQYMFIYFLLLFLPAMRLGFLHSWKMCYLNIQIKLLLLNFIVIFNELYL